jgi:hypothetical protein
MRHRSAVLSCSLMAFSSLAACVQQADDRIGEAIPTAADVHIRLPDTATQVGAPTGGGDTAIGTARLAALGEIAEYYQVTRQVTRDLNGGAAFVLILVHAVVQYPPTTIDGNVYTWGPGSGALDPAEWRLVVTETDAGEYDWQLDGRSKTQLGAEFETLVAGHAIPGDEPHRGRGSFLLDFDAAERVDPIDNQLRGTVSVEYDLENRDGTAATLAMVIDSVQAGPNGEQPVHFEYDYAEQRDGSGDFQFVVAGDLGDDGSAAEQAEIRSRWLPDGQGRADARAAGGDLGDVTVTLSECWDIRFARVFYTDSLTWAPTEGEESSCAFADSALPQ